MKTKLAQFVAFLSHLDPRHIQLTVFLVMLAASVIIQSPSDGSIGPV